MSTDSLEATEAECAEGRTAPRVSLSDIEQNIERVTFLTGAQADAASLDVEVSPTRSNPLGQRVPHPSLDVLTICLIVMSNGFTIIGKSAPASAANFDAELGRKLAYEDAVRQIWPLMGFALRDRLAVA